MTSLATIYGLVDPRTGRIRYVGKTTWSLSHRLRTHMSHATAVPHTHRAHWLNALRAEGLRPEIVELEVVPIAEWEEAERGWGWQGGERCPHAKLTEVAVKEICERFAAGGVTLQSLADEHGVSIKAISRVVRGQTWSHVDRPLTFREQGAKGISRNQGNRHGAKDYWS